MLAFIFLQLDPELEVMVRDTPVSLQRAVVTDHTGTIRLTLWRKFAHSLQVGQQYTLTNLRKATWQDECQLSNTSTTIITVHKILLITNNLVTTSSYFIMPTWITWPNNHIICYFSYILLQQIWFLYTKIIIFLIISFSYL